MLIVKINGGLGNQLFQYSFGIFLESIYNEPVHYDIVSYEHVYKMQTARKLLISSLINNNIINSGISINNKIDYYLYSLFNKKNIKNIINENNFILTEYNFDTINYYIGYWQNIHYINLNKSSIAISINNFLENNINFSIDGYLQNYHNISFNYQNSVALHVRRGDYVKNKKTKLYHGLLSVNYYFECISFFNLVLQSPNFYFFSDDIDWCKKTFSHLKNTFFVESKGSCPDISDLYFMSLFKNIVISNSTFSWWAGFLSSFRYKDKNIIFAPIRWNNISKKDNNIYMKHWLKK